MAKKCTKHQLVLSLDQPRIFLAISIIEFGAIAITSQEILRDLIIITLRSMALMT